MVRNQTGSTFESFAKAGVFRPEGKSRSNAFLLRAACRTPPERRNNGTLRPPIRREGMIFPMLTSNKPIARISHRPSLAAVAFPLLIAASLSAPTTSARGDDAPAPAAAPSPGHSLHGESFSEGPRRRLPLSLSLPRTGEGNC